MRMERDLIHASEEGADAFLEQVQGDLLEADLDVIRGCIIKSETDLTAVLALVVLLMDVDGCQQLSFLLDVPPLEFEGARLDQLTCLGGGDRFDVRIAVRQQGYFVGLHFLERVECAFNELGRPRVQTNRGEVRTVLSEDPDVATTHRASVGQVIAIELIEVLAVAGEDALLGFNDSGHAIKGVLKLHGSSPEKFALPIEMQHMRVQT